MPVNQESRLFSQNSVMHQGENNNKYTKSSIHNFNFISFVVFSSAENQLHEINTESYGTRVSTTRTCPIFLFYTDHI